MNFNKKRTREQLDHVVDDDEDNDLLEFLKNGKSTSSCLSSSSSSATARMEGCPPIYFYLVEHVITNEQNESIELILIKPDESGAQRYCYLYDSWTNTKIAANDYVHVLTDVDVDGTYHINDTKGYIIVNPQYILSGTNIMSGVGCMRKSALNWKFKDANKDPGHYMVLGTLLHMLFQYSIDNKIYEKENLRKLLIELLHQKQIITQLYEIGKNEKFILEEASCYLSSIEKWLNENVSSPKTTTTTSTTMMMANKPNKENKRLTTSAKNFHVLNVCDIEESIWSPKYGFKGKLDLTLHVQVKPNAFRTLAHVSSKPCNDSLTSNGSSSNGIETHVIPVELKSGRTTYSIEHEGQVMLYSLLNKEKKLMSTRHNSDRESNASTDFGLLLYLKEMNSKFIRINHSSLKGLLQLRNDFVYFISKNEMPHVKNDERYCAKCPLLVTCSLFNEQHRTNTKDLEPDLELYSKSISHLSARHREFFFNWYTMLELEFGDYRQFDSGNHLWWKSKSELEATGFSLFDLKITSSDDENHRAGLESVSNGFFACELSRDASFSVDLQLKENDMVLLSSQSNDSIGISQGFIKTIRSNSIALMLDKNMNNYFKANAILSDGKSLARDSHLFRIDKINYRAAISLNYTNLAHLMSSDGRCDRLRSLLIDKKTPAFETSLSKQMILNTKSLFKRLNQSQKMAIVKTLMTKDYLLIKGYPGTGKTTTIAAMIAVLTQLGKKVLFTSFTNSAVDNLLLKLVRDYSKIDFVRIGSIDRIHAELRKYESNQLTLHIKSVEMLDEFYANKQLVATTCSSFGNVIFGKLNFDYCIIDEASQVLLTTCLGPLFCSAKFILVGDLEQLPPIIKNKEAKLLGMDISLFESIDSPEGSVELVHQYRMNREIMNLANEITYEHKLKCMSDSIANSTLTLVDNWNADDHTSLTTSLMTKSVLFVDTTELIKPLGLDSTKLGSDYRTVNVIESQIISKVCDLLRQNTLECNESESIGVIAPYNNQVKHLKSILPKSMEINTVDQFQGRDKRVIIVSFTNSIITNDESKEFEILNDKRRLTVAITRAKQKLILIGCIDSLVRYKPVKNIIECLERQQCILKLNQIESELI